uniref:Uncharacterized protein n=1 Tax=Ditylenchus dipsaci TaxID=166011 RepID=A0A915CR63_9BILA
MNQCYLFPILKFINSQPFSTHSSVQSRSLPLYQHSHQRSRMELTNQTKDPVHLHHTFWSTLECAIADDVIAAMKKTKLPWRREDQHVTVKKYLKISEDHK